MEEQRALETARKYFLSSGSYGCAETTLLVLREAYGLPGRSDASAAMALNGGVAWRGATCGVILGAGIALGELGGQRVASHKAAKRVARCLLAQFTERFESEYGATDCRQLIGQEIYTDEQHADFIASGVWRETCMDQITFAVQELLPLQEEKTWREAIEAIDTTD